MPNLKYSIEPPRYNLPANTAVTFGFSATCQVAHVLGQLSSPSTIYGRWNINSVSSTLFDFFLNPTSGDAWKTPSEVTCSAVTLISDSAQTYGTDFAIKGF